MFKKKFLSILLALSAVVLLPSFAFAQMEETMPEDDEVTVQIQEDQESTETTDDITVEWDYEFDWDNLEDDYEDEYDAEDIAAASTLLAGLGFIGIAISSLMGIAAYVYTSLAYMKIAKKLNHPNSWFAWIPILNIVLHLQLAGMSGWYILLMLVPVANVVVYVIAMMNICEKLDKEKLLGLLVLVPFANFILLGILAWGKNENEPVQQTPQQQVQQPQPQQQPVQNEEESLKPKESNQPQQ
jgi:hypothetical protein